MSDFAIEVGKIILSAIAGGIAGHLTSRRSERNTAIKELLNLIANVADLAEEYWSQANNSPNVSRLARRLRAKLGDVGRINTRIRRDHPTYRFASDAVLVAFRQSVTGGNFDVHGRPAEMDRIVEIHDAAARLRDYVRGASCNAWQVPIQEWLDIVWRTLKPRKPQRNQRRI